VFANKVFWLPILGDLGRVIKIYKAGYNAEIVWDCGMVLSVALGRDYTGKIEIVD